MKDTALMMLPPSTIGGISDKVPGIFVDFNRLLCFKPRGLMKVQTEILNAFQVTYQTWITTIKRGAQIGDFNCGCQPKLKFIKKKKVYNL